MIDALNVFAAKREGAGAGGDRPFFWGSAGLSEYRHVGVPSVSDVCGRLVATNICMPKMRFPAYLGGAKFQRQSILRDRLFSNSLRAARLCWANAH